MRTEKAFGIGCFHFSINKVHPFKFQGSEYLKELREVLSKISNLNNLKIKTDDKFESWCEDIDEPLPNLENYEGFFPCASLYFNLSFELYIPFRIQEEIQEEIFETKVGLLDTFGENFRVTILHGFHAPVTIIEVINPSKTPTPSTAVMLVREFIKKEPDRNKSDYIKFESIGPSPFHMECYIKPQKPKVEEEWLFKPEEKIQRGYNHCIINYNEDKFKDSSEVLDYLEHSIVLEFGYFYQCVLIRNGKMHTWESISDNLDKLKQIQESRGIRGVFLRLTKRYFLIEKLIVSLSTFESQDIMNKGINRNQYQDLYPTKEVAFFKTSIDSELKEVINYPIRQAINLINFFEDRRAKNAELFILLIAAISGGVVGSIITIYFH